MTVTKALSRRKFLIGASAIAGGFALSIKVPAVPPAAARFPTVGSDFPPLNRPEDVSAWVAILEDDTVIVRVPMPEIGNGVMTQAAVTVAEELRCDVEKLKPEFASPTRDYLEDAVYTSTAGMLPSFFFCGRSTEEGRQRAFLQAGASARERLKAAAAAEWDVSVAEIEAEKSILTHTPTGKTLRYGEVAAAAGAIQLETEPEIKPEEEWTILGTYQPGKLNNPQIVTGEAVYGIDVILPDMLYAALIQAPVRGGRLKSYDADAIKDMPGVHSVVVIDPDEPLGEPAVPAPYDILGPVYAPQAGIAVVAEHYWQARKALDALPVDWEDGDGAQMVDQEMLKEVSFGRIEAGEVEPAITLGDLSGLDTGEPVVADYWTPYCEHAMLEPLNGTALVTEDGVDLWISSQEQMQYFSVAATVAGVAPEKTNMHQTFVGGAFGRHNWGDDAAMVVAVAKQVPGRPVHVIWTREETFRQGRYRDAVAARFQATLGENKLPEALKIESVAGPMAMSWSGPLLQGTIVPNVSAGAAFMMSHILTGPYRGPGYNSTTFMIESFVDELAHAAGIDPLEYRLKLYETYVDPGWTKVLEVAAEKAGWGKTLTKGQGMGIAVGNWAQNLAAETPFFGSTICTVAQVEVTQAGELTVSQLDVAFDVGRITNEDAVRAQLEGGTLFGYNMSMNEELTIENGRIVEGNYDVYPVIRMADAPVVNIHLDALMGDPRHSEIGELPVGTVGPAIANAIFAATGKRIRSTPFLKQDLSWS